MAVPDQHAVLFDGSYLGARGDTPVQVNPVPRGLTRRQGGSVRSRTVPLVRVPRTLPRILSPQEADCVVGALRTHRDRAMVWACCWSACASAKCWGYGLRTCRSPTGGDSSLG